VIPCVRATAVVPARVIFVPVPAELDGVAALELGTAALELGAAALELGAVALELGAAELGAKELEIPVLDVPALELTGSPPLLDAPPVLLSKTPALEDVGGTNVEEEDKRSVAELICTADEGSGLLETPDSFCHLIKESFGYFKPSVIAVCWPKSIGASTAVPDPHETRNAEIPNPVVMDTSAIVREFKRPFMFEPSTNVPQIYINQGV
jgi:hypothetical protein